MSWIINQIKIKALVDFINQVNEKDIVDLLENFAHKYFGEEWKKSLQSLQVKLAKITIEIGKRTEA